MELETTLTAFGKTILLIASGGLLILTSIALTPQKLSESAKRVLFGGIVLLVIVPTLYLALSTLYLNSVAESKGPVHWHSDIEFWQCGKALDLINPQGLSNKIGTPTFHEHNDNRIHVEGVVVRKDEVSLGNFVRVIGGRLTNRSLLLPTTTGPVMMQSGEVCPNGEEGRLQVFVYTVQDNVYYQAKLGNPAAYTLSAESAVPAGDCIIVEFDRSKAQTDKLCRSYRVAEQIGKIRKGGKNGH